MSPLTVYGRGLVPRPCPEAIHFANTDAARDREASCRRVGRRIEGRSLRRRTPMSDTVGSTSDAGAVGNTSPGTGPAQYLREAIRIVRFDEDAIGRVAGDRKALKYGACVVAIAGVLSYVSELLGASAAAEPMGALGHAVAIAVVVPLQLLASAVHIGVIHVLGKLLLGATGSYVSLLRVLWLASVVTWLAVIPVVGAIAAGIWFLLIMLVTFENVDGLERLQALALVVGISAAMMFLRTFLP